MNSHEQPYARIVAAKLNDAEACSRIKYAARLKAYIGIGIDLDKVKKMAKYNSRNIDKTRTLIAKSHDSPEASHFVVAKRGNKTVGFARSESDNGKTVELKWIFVDPAFQSRGIGSALLDDCLQWSKGREITLKVVKGNQKAIALYENRGFKNIGVEPFSRYNIPQVLMKKEAEIYAKT